MAYAELLIYAVFRRHKKGFLILMNREALYFPFTPLDNGRYSHAICPDLLLLRFTFTLLAIAAAANNADEIMNSPEKKPNRPIKNINAVNASL
jgi:hypothetical protein